MTPYGPLEAEPTGFVPEAEQFELLLEPFANLALGAHDRRILLWLAGWDWSTVGTIVSLLHRARVAAPLDGGEPDAGGA